MNPVSNQPLPELAAAIDEHLLQTVGANPAHASPAELLQAVSQVARQQLSKRWVATQTLEAAAKARRIYYLSMEFLIGRTLGNALEALDLNETAAQGIAAHARRLEDVAQLEVDAALGNGGLGIPAQRHQLSRALWWLG